VFIHRHIGNVVATPISPIQQQTTNNSENSPTKANLNSNDTSITSQNTTKVQLGFKDNNPVNKFLFYFVSENNFLIISKIFKNFRKSMRI